MAERGAAFFDMDGTLLKVNTAQEWIKHQWRLGELGTWDFVRSMGWAARYKLAMVDMARVSEEAVGQLAGQEEEALRAQMAAWYVESVRAHLMAPVVERVRAHEARGEQVVVLTASSPYITAPLAEDLGGVEYLCTRFEVREGRFTGRLDGELCYGEGKVVHARRWAEARGVSLERSTFYTDSYTDLPMLEAVGTPVVVNPDPRLWRMARRRGWAQLLVM
jgi:HAD superfamily hydrolase (TIGR01490 family)